MVKDSRFQNGRLTGGSSHGAGKQGGSMEKEVKRESFRGAFDNRQVSSLDQEIEGGKGFVTHT